MSSTRLTMTVDRFIRWLIYAAIGILPIIVVLDLRPFINGPITNVQVVKYVASYSIVAVIAILNLMWNGVRPYRNGWLCGLLIFMCLDWMIAPQYDIQVMGENVSGFWVFRCVVEALLFYLFIMAVSAIDWTKERLNTLFNIICWAVWANLGLLFFQYIGWDQLMTVYDNSHVLAQTNPELTGFLGQSTFLGTFLAMCLPIIICQRKWLLLAATITGLILVNSMVGFAMAGFVGLFYVFYYGNEHARMFMTVVIAGILTGAGKIIPFVISQGSGRFDAWSQAIKLIVENKLAMTGVGAGSFEFMLTPQISGHWVELHNEFLEFFCHLGSAGIFLLIFSLFFLLKSFFMLKLKDRYSVAAVCCFLSICFGNLAHFMWQFEPHRFYSAVMLGIMLNYILKEDRKCSNELES